MANEQDTPHAHQAQRLVRPIAETGLDTLATAVAPDLATQLHTLQLRLRDMLEEVNDRFQSEADKATRTYAEFVLASCRRELTHEWQNRALLHEIEDCLPLLLTKGKRVRLT